MDQHEETKVGSMGIMAGHGRLLAARKLKLDQVPAIVLDHLTEAQVPAAP